MMNKKELATFTIESTNELHNMIEEIESDLRDFSKKAYSIIDSMQNIIIDEEPDAITGEDNE